MPSPIYLQKSQADSSPAISAVAVTPDNSNDLSVIPARALWIGTAGDVSVDPADGANTAVVFKNASGLLPVSVKRVRSTNTTASNIVALY